MNKNDFLNLIGSTNPIDRQVLSELNELVNIFPYFQTAHLLLLKGLQDNSDIRFENQLKNSAIHIADREVLFNLLKVSGTGLEKETIPEPAEAEIQRPHEEEKEPIKELPGEELQTGIKPDETIITGDIEQTVIESAKSSEELISQIEGESLGKSGEEGHEKYDEVIGHSILISMESDADEPQNNIMIFEDDSSANEERIFYMDPGFSVPETDDFPETVITNKIEPGLITEIRKTLMIPGAEPVVTEPEPAPEIISESESVSDIAGVPLEDVRAQKKQVQADLIEKFILANPRIEPSRERIVQTQEDLSYKFTEERGDFVTETLARIYINQGYYSRAIDIYEKLSLKFPEKSGYFAAQIEKVKAIIK